MRSEERQRQIDELRLELAEEAQQQDEPSDEEINAIAVAAVREYRQEEKRRWQAEHGMDPARPPRMALSTVDAKENWAALLRFVYQQGVEVAIERRGEPIAVLMSYADFLSYDRLAWEVRLKEMEERRRNAGGPAVVERTKEMERFLEVEKQQRRVEELRGELTKDLTEGEADSIIKRLTEEDRVE